MKNIVISLRVLIVLILLTGVIYPLLITVVGQILWPYQAGGSLIKRENKVIGSELLAQKFTHATYFYSRPSAVDYASIPSGASNLSALSSTLAETIKARTGVVGARAPADLVSASGSGLDPHLSIEAVAFQVQRITQARNLSSEQKKTLEKIIEENTEYPILGFIGERIINVLNLNLALDREFK